MPTKADEKPSTPKNSALTLLEQDHREVDAYFEEYEKAQGEAKEAVAKESLEKGILLQVKTSTGGSAYVMLKANSE